MIAPSRIVLVGFMGSGKSTVGGLLAATLGYRSIDSDLELAREAGFATPGEALTTLGEARFREAERNAIRAILAGEPIEVFNYGHHRRDFTYIDDIVEGVIRVLDRPASPNPDWDGASPDPATSAAPYRIYNIGNQHPVELLRYIEVLEDCLGKRAEKILLPLQPGDVPDTHAEVSDLVRDTGYKPDTAVETGIARFVAWYRGYYGV